MGKKQFLRFLKINHEVKHQSGYLFKICRVGIVREVYLFNRSYTKKGKADFSKLKWALK